ncbi:MAG: amino acid adenylation domain-containing protein, partial [bacterium]|nr:amino acid adenylation domain-containing protein [bacterium]
KNGYLHKEGMVLAPDGHCRAFDAKAAGCVEGNGAGIVLLKLLENALEDHDHIYAMVKGTAVNNDGNRKIGFSAPSVKGQAEVIRTARLAAEVETESITYVETHGSGTPLGDPVEIRALKQAFDTDKRHFCRIGSVKSNMGHLDSAAGAAGFIKTVLSIWHRQIPASLHFETPNPQIDFENSPFVVNTGLVEWKNDRFPLRAGVSSFGIGGTNAHVVLEEAPRNGKEKEQEEQQPLGLLLISARTEGALERNTAKLSDHLRKNNAADFRDVLYTLQVGRKGFEHRRMMVCRNMAEAVDALSMGNSKKILTNTGNTAAMENPPLVFMFPGLGSQYVNMGQGLYQREPVFREAMDRCFKTLGELTPFNIKDILYPGDSPGELSPSIHQFDISQPVIFSFEYALARLLLHFGFRPRAMIGYSFGEYVAACISGVFSVADALRLIVARGELVKESPRGGMLSVPLPREEVTPMLDRPGLTGELSLAIDNGPSCIVAGPTGAIGALEIELKEKKLMCMRLNTSHAIHSSMMDSILAAFKEKVQTVTLNAPQIPYISNLTGQWISDAEATDPDYWVNHLAKTVRFSEGIGQLVKEPRGIFLELGPGRDLSALIQRSLGEDHHTVNLARPETKEIDDYAYLLDRVGRLWLWGAAVDWKTFYPEDEIRRRVPLPTYSFEKHRFNVKVAVPFQPRDRGQATGSMETGAIEPAPHEYSRPRLPDNYEAPRDAVEEKIAAVFRAIFGLDRIGISEDFFELGGDSLKAINLVTRLHQDLEVDIPMEAVFDFSTIKDIAGYVGQKSETRLYAAIPLAEKKEYYPVTPPQQRVFVMDQMEEDNQTYNQTSLLWLEGSLDVPRLEHALTGLMERHESLRTGFLLPDTGQPVQRVYTMEEIPFTVRHYDTGGDEEKVAPIVREFVRGFDLSRPPLWRVGLVKVTEEKYLLMQNLHHIINDDISTGIMMFEFARLFRGGNEPLEELPVQFKDYAEWQSGESAGQELERQKAFWLNLFSGELPVLDMPCDFPRPAVKTYEGAHIDFQMEADTAAKLHHLARQARTTLFVVCFALYNVLLHRYSGQRDIVTGAPITGRSHRDVQQVVGMFVNTLALRNYPGGEKTFSGFLAEVKGETLKAFANQLYQFDDLVEELNPERDMSRSPLFDTMFVLHTVDPEKLKFPGITLSGYEGFDVPTAKFDITLNVAENIHGALNMMLEYNTSLFREETMMRFKDNFAALVETVVENPAITLEEIPLDLPEKPVNETPLLDVDGIPIVLTEEERKRILYEFNDTGADYPHDKTVSGLFEDRADAAPHHIALIGEAFLPRTGADSSPRRCALTYYQLNESANEWACRLKNRGVAEGDVVAVITGRTLELVIGILAILKTGAAYLPIDPQYPAERIRYMVEHTGAQVILTTGQDISFEHTAEIMDLTRPGNSPVPFSPVPLSPTSLAYVIYTSGTTGIPKGVMIENRSLVNFIKGITDVIPFDGDDSILSLTTQGFDIFGMETLLPLTRGTTVILGTGEEQLDAPAAADALEKERVTILQLTPSRLKLFISDEESAGVLKQLNHLVVGGEAFPPALLEKTRPLVTGKIYNVYGPTETTIWSAIKDVTGNNELNIGKPLANTRIYITGEKGQLQPVGVPGELCISGHGTARGYWEAPDLTDEKFTDNPFVNPFDPDKDNYRRMYHTGDLAQWLPDGNIEFMGRIDHQVKIRGYRIELGEVEHRLCQHQTIKEAVVTAWEDNAGDEYLCAYIVPLPGHTVPPVEECRAFLAHTLPDYMVPSYFMPMETIPLTPNGKIDRKSLPAPALENQAEYASPRNPIETKLVEIWSDVLLDENINRESPGRPGGQIGIDDNFFNLGGHSLRGTVVVSKIHKELDVKITLGKIFKTPTIRGLAASIKESGKSSPQVFAPVAAVELKEYYPLSSAQKRLYILQQMEPGVSSYNLPTMVMLEGQLDTERIESAIGQLIRRHESLRTSFHMVVEEPVQRVHKTVELDIELFGRGVPLWSPLNGNNSGSHGGLPLQQTPGDFVRPFDLSDAPLLRVGLNRLDDLRHLLSVDVHHIIFDGSSFTIFFRELMTLYNQEPLEPLTLQYKDYALWQNREGEQETLKNQEAYWARQFETDPPVLNIPTDYPRPLMQSFEGDSLSVELDREILEGLTTLAQNQRATLFMVLLAAFNVLFSKLSGQEDIILGTPAAGRDHSDFQGIIGIFVNTLVMRNFPIADATFTGFLRDVGERTLEVFENQDFQFEDLVELASVNVKRDTARNPLFDVMFTLQNMEAADVEIPGLKLKPCPKESNGSKFDISIDAVGHEEGLSLTVEYCTMLFKRETIQRYMNYFNAVIAAILDNPDRALGDIQMIAPAEREQLLYEFNDTAREYPLEKTIHQLFGEQAARTPEGPALTGWEEDGTETTLTYGELNRRSRQFAHHLQEKGVGPGTIAALMIHRSPGMIIAILGILQTGAAYLPIDTTLPVERIKYMLADSHCSFCISGEGELGLGGINDQLSIINYQLLMKNSAASALFAVKSEHTLPPTNPIYIIYTSGSTGKPKGVMIRHREVHNFIIGITDIIDFPVGKSILALTTISFDIFVLETLLPLCRGLRVVMATVEQQRDSVQLSGVIEGQGIDMLQATPSRMQLLVQDSASARLSCLERLTTIMIGGEAFPLKLLKDLQAATSARIYNMYGPTETTVWSAVEELTRAETVTIGRPIANTQLYILDKRFNVQPVGVAGDLWIGGDGLAAGYVNKSELTKEKFEVRSSNFELYSTGDLARWLPGGTIEFIGRIDNQVKIRGFRIELGEIESQLLNHSEIDGVVVRVMDGNLTAYIVSRRPFPVSDLREYISRHLPDYMIPSYFVPLDEIPLTPSGKVDGKSLPLPEFEASASYVAPSGPEEERAAAIWSEVLHIDKGAIGSDDNFFELGGHSLRATIVISKIHMEMSVDISLGEMFKTPTVRGLARHIKSAVREEYVPVPAAPESEYYALSPAQKRLYMLQQMDLLSIAYNLPNVMVMEGAMDKDKLEAVFRLLVLRHESFRASFTATSSQEVVQEVHPGETVSLTPEYYDLSKGAEAKAGSIIQSFIRPFDLESAPLIRIGLIKTGLQTYIFMIDMHHIISDGTSMGILVEDFMALYSGKPLEPLTLHYKDYSYWKTGNQRRAVERLQEAFWLNQFSGDLPVVNLPIDFPRPATRDYSGRTLGFRVEEGVARRLRELAKGEKVSLFVLLLAIYNIFIYKVTGQGDLLVGTQIAGRKHVDLQRIIGVFLNTLVLRNRFNSDAPFVSHLAPMMERTLNAFENQDYPFEDLVEKRVGKRHINRNPLFDVMFIWQNMEMEEIRIPGLTLKPYEGETKTASLIDLTLYGFDRDDHLYFYFEYGAALFREETIRRFITYFEEVVSAVISDKTVTLSDIKISHGLASAGVSHSEESDDEFEF